MNALLYIDLRSTLRVGRKPAHLPHWPVNPDKIKRWIACLRNHKDAIAALDFFTVPTASLQMLYVLFVIKHGQRRIVRFNVTATSGVRPP